LLDISERRELENRLVQSERLDAIGKLTGGLAHDLNNLLAAILSGLGLLERRAKLDGNATQIVEMMQRSAKQGADLVSRMLAFSRRQQLRPSAVPLSELADTMNGLVAQGLGALIRFEWLIGEDAWPAHVDAGQLELALMNLVFNARDAMSSGGTISVEAQNRTVEEDAEDLMAGDYVVVTVKDTGSGIAPDILPKVIEPFFTTKTTGKGTGLGLSTVYGFARQSGGTLRIDSVVGRGTSMELWLPRSLEKPAGPVTKLREPEVRPVAGETLPSVLLVDDSTSLRDLTAQSLRDHGFEVATAAGGAEALAMIERGSRRFDVIVTDFAMPLVSGLDVVRFARNLRPGWPAIIITGYADAGIIQDRPADVPLLAKPFSEAALIDTIVMAGRGPQRL
jgi:CheY-like chemotaxis protein